MNLWTYNGLVVVEGPPFVDEFPLDCHLSWPFFWWSSLDFHVAFHPYADEDE